MKHAKRKPSLIRPGFIVGINAVAFRAEIDASRITILGRYIHDPKRSRPFLCVHTDGDSCAWTPLTSSQYSADVRRIHVDGGSYLRGPCYLFEGPRASWTDLEEKAS